MGLFVMFLFGIALLINVEFAHKKTGSDLEKSLSEPVLLNFFNVLLLSWKFSETHQNDAFPCFSCLFAGRVIY